MASFTVIFVLLLAGSTWFEILPPALPVLYLGLSLVTLAVYWRDKSAARERRWRTRESTLQLLALVGGWPGALLAQRLLRHKCSKPSFQAIFYATVALNCSALLLYATPAGSRLLQLLPDRLV
jgi:uncharacterized membrane protein YsdA (DUF1294 family)